MSNSPDGLDIKGYRSGYVALVGKPNVGKSTLLNAYIGQKIAAVSFKPQTTRRRQLGIMTTGDSQIIFIDTPGLHSGDYKLSRFINEEAEYALMDADLLLFIVDASLPPDEEDRFLAGKITAAARDKTVLLVLNKADLVDPGDITVREQAFKELLDFDGFLWISANSEEGRDALFREIIAHLPEGPQYFPEEQITSTYEREITADLIRAAALHHLQDEVPYAIHVRVNDYLMRDEGIRYIHATVFVERESHKGIVIGKSGSMIKAISTMAREEIEEMSGEQVYLELQVKVEKNWRNNPDFLNRYGLSHD
jgi:GTP-binding protein Era